jgi:hypothetical protein
LFVLGTHRAPNRKKIQPSVQIQTTTRRKNKNEEGRKVWLRKREENHPEEHGFSNRHVSTTIIPPLTHMHSPYFRVSFIHESTTLFAPSQFASPVSFNLSQLVPAISFRFPLNKQPKKPTMTSIIYCHENFQAVPLFPGRLSKNRFDPAAG